VWSYNYIASERQERLSKILDTLLEIQWISYAEPWIQKYKGIRLRLHLLCFLFAKQLQANYHALKGEGLLFLHTITSHYGPWFEKHDFRSGSSEQGEQFLAICKRFGNLSNRKQEDILLQILVRGHLEQEVTNCIGQKVKKTQDFDEFTSKQWHEIIFPHEFLAAHIIDIKAFLSYLNSLGYQDQVDYKMKPTPQDKHDLHFNTLYAVNEYLAERKQRKNEKPNRLFD